MDGCYICVYALWHMCLCTVGAYMGKKNHGGR